MYKRQDLFNDKNNDIESITMVYREPFTHQMEDSQFAEDKIYTEMGLSNFYKLPSELKENLNKQYRFASDEMCIRDRCIIDIILK